MAWRKNPLKGPKVEDRSTRGFHDGNAAALRHSAKELADACPRAYPNGQPFDGPALIQQVTEAAISIGYQQHWNDGLDLLMVGMMVRAMVSGVAQEDEPSAEMLAATGTAMMTLRQRGFEEQASAYHQGVDAVLAYHLQLATESQQP